jgi:dTDP-4-dehydrorhamnose 3,5-epimerase
MTKIQVTETPLSGVLMIEPAVFQDSRGFLLESYNERRYGNHGIQGFVQDNYCHSMRNVLRGLHFQRRPQGKLIYVTSGAIFDVAVDIRKSSPTYANWFAVELSSENHKQIYIPAGFAHGFCVLSYSADVHYKFTDYYDPADECGILWSDPRIGIDWPVADPVLSDRDKMHSPLENISVERLPVYYG